MDSFSLKGRTAAVTGGLGRVGRGVVHSLAKAGAKVLVLDIAQDGKEILKDIMPKRGLAQFADFDTTHLDDLSERVREVEQRFFPLDIWVNCAYPRTADWGLAFEKTTPRHWLKNIELQLCSTCLCAEAAAGEMAGRGGGVIVNVGSIYGVQAPDFGIYAGTDKTTPSIYSAAKGGIIAHTRWLASRFAEYKVRANVVCPGGVRSGQTEPFLSQFNAKTLLGRMADPREVGDPVVFLASEASSYITGQILMVDGGMSCI